MPMKHGWRRLCLVLVVVMVGACSAPAIVYADVNDFIINKFQADYSLSRIDPQGELAITETIDVTFADQNHGILRALPNDYKNHRLQLHIENVHIKGQTSQWSTYQSDGNTVLKIGDPEQTVTGQQQYTISYTVRNVIGFYDDHDELYWDINGDEWAQPAELVSLHLRLPDDAKLSKQTPVCYTGSFGSTEHACSVSNDNRAHVLSVTTTHPLQPYQTLSVVTGFEKGYFHPSAWYETAREYAGIALAFLAPFVLLAGTAGRHWYRYGRDAKGRGTIFPAYEPPDHLKPIEAGTIADFKTDNRDITATIIDLAIRGYITIIEQTEELRFRRDRTTYSLRLEKTDFSGLESFETKIINGLFSEKTVGATIDLDTMKYKLMATAGELRTSLHERLVAAGYFRKNPLSVTLRFAGRLALAFLVGLVLAAMYGGPAAIGLFVGVAVAIGFLILMPSRLPKGVAAKEEILGLKMYLEVAEAERIKKLQSPNAAYAPKTDEPKRTVKLFEKLLPFAMVLGVEQEWAKQFEDIYRTPPDWYQGNWTSSFSAMYLTSSLASGIQPAVNSAFSSPSSSSSSGFSGGGAGGGGGGGGGGGW
jgi:uncharacterized membrane protein